MNYQNITHDDMLNGDGLRVVLWVSGCSHHCTGCQNPTTWDPNDGLTFDEDAKREIFNDLSKSYIDGVTFSGGDPLHSCNVEAITNLSREIKEKFPDKTIWIYTGASFDQIKDLEIMKLIDVLVDGEFVEDLKDNNFKWAGSTNQRVIDVQQSIIEKRVVLYANN